MTDTELAKVQRFKSSMTKLVVGVVSVIGLLAVTTILQPTESFTAESSVNQSSGLGRKIASTTADEQITTKASYLVLDVDCENGREIKADVEQVRLRGEACTQGKQIVRSTITNTANGYVATVFQQKPARFTTDYIQLLKGRNDLVIENELSNGEVEKRNLFIIR